MLVASDDPVAGGGERQARLLAERLRADGLRVTIATGAPARGAAAPAPRGRGHGDDEVVRLARLPVLRGWCLAAGLLVWAWRHRGRADVIHAHTAPLGVIACLVSWLTGSAVVVKISSLKSFGCLHGRGSGRALRRWVVRRRASWIVAVSQELHEALVADGYAPGQVVLVPNGVERDGGDLDGDAEAFRAEVAGGRDVPVVLFVGRLVPEKALEHLLDVWAALPPGPRVLVLVGDGPLRQALEAAVARRGLAGSVRFVGRRRDVARFYAIADVFVLPSHTEGMSNALLEAMAAGLAVMASGVGGNRDVVTPGTGVLVDWHDVPTCAAALAALLGRPDLRRHLGEAARQRADAFGMEAVASRYRALYAEAMVVNRADRASA
jgi:glycosyltransferase involved in cell wall biosynthesis